MSNVDMACAHFRKLLEEQMARIGNMNTEKVDFRNKETVTIGIIDGDGIGPIIMEQAVRVLKKLLADDLASGKIVLKRIEGLTIENRLAQNKPVPEDVLASILCHLRVVKEFIKSQVCSHLLVLFNGALITGHHDGEFLPTGGNLTTFIEGGLEFCFFFRI